MRLVDADELIEFVERLEEDAFEAIREAVDRCDDKTGMELLKWSVVIRERKAFKHELIEAPTIYDATVDVFREASEQEEGVLLRVDNKTYKITEVKE